MQRSIGNSLREYRIKHNYTEKEMATKCNISKQAWSNYENGNRNPDVAMLDSIAKEFGLSIDYLSGATDLAYNPRDKQFINLITEFQKMNEKQKHKLIKIAHKIQED